MSDTDVANIAAKCNELCGGLSELATSSFGQMARDTVSTGANAIGTVGQGLSTGGELVSGGVEVVETTAEGAVAGPVGAGAGLVVAGGAETATTAGNIMSFFDDIMETAIDGASAKSAYEDYQLYEELAGACADLCSKEETWKNRNSQELQTLIDTITQLKAQIDAAAAAGGARDSNQDELIQTLVNVNKEQDHTIQGLRQDNDLLQSQVDALEERLSALENEASGD